MSQNSTVSTDKSVPQPSFINDSNGLKLINDFNLSVSDLQLYAKKSFALFAIDRFVFRYNIASNMIDTIVDLGEIEGFKHHEISCAADGRYLISYFYYTDSKNDELITENYYLIDLEQQNSIFLADTFSEKNSEIARKKIPEELQMEFYNLSFYDEELKSDRIAESKCVSSIFKKFNGRHIWNKVGSIAFGTGLSSIVALMLGKYQNASEESWILAFSFIALGVALIALDQYKYDGKLENNCKQALDLILLLEQGFHIDNENTTMPEYSCAAEPLVQSGESHHSSPWEPLA